MLIVALFFVCVAFLFAIMGMIGYTFYLYNAANRDQTVINEYIDKASFKTVKKSLAESIINYQPANLSVSPADIKNPFRVIASNEKENINQ